MLSFFGFLGESEERINFIKKNNPDLDPSVVDHYASHDPTLNKQYTQWMVGQHKKNMLSPTLAPKVGTLLKHFHENRAFLKTEHRDINRHNFITLSDVVPEARRLGDKHRRRKEEEKGGATLVHSEPDFTVHRLNNHRGACKMGKGTQWCTSSRNDPSYFENYHAQGPLYVIQGKSQHPDKEERTYENDEGTRKFQIHFNKEDHHHEIANETDDHVEHDELHEHFPQINKVEEFKKHGIASWPFMNKGEKHALVDKTFSLDNDDHDDHHQISMLTKEAMSPDERREFRPQINKLADHPHWRARAVAAEHGDAATKMKLVDDPDSSVRMSLAYGIGEHKIHLAKKETDGHVLSALAQNTRSPDIHLALANNPAAVNDLNVARTLTDRSDNPYVLQKFLKHSDPFARAKAQGKMAEHLRISYPTKDSPNVPEHIERGSPEHFEQLHLMAKAHNNLLNQSWKMSKPQETYHRNAQNDIQNEFRQHFPEIHKAWNYERSDGHIGSMHHAAMQQYKNRIEAKKK